MLAGAVLAGCHGQPSVERGVVVQKAYEPAHDEQQNSALCLMRSDGVCVLYAQETVRVDARYRLRLEDCHDDRCRAGWVDVDRRSYRRYHVKDDYP